MKGQNHRGRKTQAEAESFLENDVDEYIANTAPTSRRGVRSITHLMDLHTPPTITTEQGPRRRKPTKSDSSRWTDINNARHVHANYRFIVRPKDDYHAQAHDPDAHLDWDQVLQVLVSSYNQLSSCLICLDTPSAPRMTRCGHIFCLPCLIHFMRSSEADEEPIGPDKVNKVEYKKCPICTEAVCLPDARPVRWHTAPDESTKPLVPGSNVILRLMKRSSKSTLCLPRNGAADLTMGGPTPWHFTPEAMDYARIILGTEEYMEEYFDLDYAALVIQGQDDELLFGSENQMWVKLALESIKQSKRDMRGIGTWEELLPDIAAMNVSDKMDSVGEEALELRKDFTPDRIQDPNPQKPFPSKAPDQYLFYQGLQHYYLTPLDIRILKAAFGDYSQFPDRITARVEHLLTGSTVDSDFRKRNRYLSHLPDGCETTFLECDFTEVVSDDILRKFSPELTRRRKLHDEKTAREDKKRDQAELLERAIQFNRLGTHIGLFSGDDVQPVVNADDFVPLPSQSIGRTDDSSWQADDIQTYGGLNLVSSPVANVDRNGTSTIAVANKTETATTMSPSAGRTVWGTAAVPPSVSNENENENGEYLQQQSYYNDDRDKLWAGAWGDVGAVNVVGMSVGEDGKGGGKGKKRGRKITLMSTNVRRSA